MRSKTKVAGLLNEARLTLKQRAFCQAYVGEAQGNATAAARGAGYKGSDKTLSVVGHENLRKPKVRNFISDLQGTMERKFNLRLISSGEVLDEISAIAKAPWQDFVEVKYGKRGKVLRVRIRLAEKLKALDLIGRHYRLWDRGERPIDDPEEFLARLLKMDQKRLPPAPEGFEGEMLEAEDVSEEPNER